LTVCFARLLDACLMAPSLPRHLGLTSHFVLQQVPHGASCRLPAAKVRQRNPSWTAQRRSAEDQRHQNAAAAEPRPISRPENQTRSAVDKHPEQVPDPSVTMARRAIILLLPLVSSVAAFSGLPAVVRQPSRKASGDGGRAAPLRMGGGSGYASTPTGKKDTVEKIKGLLETSEMIFSIPAGSMSVAQTQALRRSLPQGTAAAVVKNTLMERAVQGTDFEVAARGSLLKGPNLWFFIEEDIGGTIKAFQGFTKDYGKKESHPILGGVVEATEYDTSGVEAIGQLPSKQELYAKIAGSIKAVPTKVARVIKAPSDKLARAIKMATMPDDE